MRISNATKLLTRSRSTLVVVIALVVVLGGVVAVGAARAVALAPASIWGNAKPAHVKLAQGVKGAELGTTFTPAVGGQVTAVRFYKLKGENGTHTGSIWSPDGDRLAAVTFTNETSSGWQTAKLSAPIDLTAGTHYVVSYRVPVGGRYAMTTKFSGRSTTPALRVTRHNSGVYAYIPGAHPRSDGRSSQYWADVTFVPGSAHGFGGSPTPTPTATKSATPRPSPSDPSSPSATPTPTPTPIPSASSPSGSSSASGGFPTRASAGLPGGWVPVTRVTGDYYVRTAGAVVSDLQITNGTIFVEAPNVTLNRIQGIGAFVNNGPGSTCNNGLLVENSTFTPNGTTSDRDDPVIQFGGYTAKNIVIDGAPEGLRIGGTDLSCGPVTVQDSFIRVASPTVCTDWHGDGIQGYGGNKVTVRNTTILMTVTNGCYGTAPFFYPSNQGNTAIDIDGLLLGGSSGYPFRDGMPGTVKNLNVINGSWVYNPIVDVNCAAITSWQAQVVTLNTNGQPVPTGKTINCTGTGN